MKEYHSTATISASPETVWKVLADASSYGMWNPEIVRIDGRIAAGSRITAHVRLGDGKIRTVGQRVTVLDAPMRMEWEGGMPLGLFVGRRIFMVTPVAGGAEFRLHLQMRGPMLSLILRSVGDRQPEIDSFTAALKRRVESAEGDSRPG